jgi:predicted dehydrogenase
MPGAYRYRGQQMYVAQNAGGMDERQQVNIPPKNQFAEEIDHMADCILADRRPRTPGEEGLQDHVVMEAIYESARTGRPVALKRYDGLDVFRGPMPTA